MKRNTYLWGGLIAIVLAVIAVESSFDNSATLSPVVISTDGARFTGKITAVETGCFYDATCSVSVDGKKVIITTGGRGPWQEKPVGSIIGADSIGDLESRIGDTVHVYATTTEEGDYSLYGDTDFYIEVVDAN